MRKLLKFCFMLLLFFGIIGCSSKSDNEKMLDDLKNKALLLT